MIGGLYHCSVFKIAGVRSLLEKFKPDEAFTKQNAIEIIGQNDPETHKPNFKQYENLYLFPRKIGSKLKPDHIFEFVTKKSIFSVGLEIQCTNCELKFWKGIDNLKSKLRCEFCGYKFEILSQLKDRDWFYRRSGIFGRDDNQLSAIPIALTLHQLHNHFHFKNFVYLTSMSIKPSGANINECETDFIILMWDHDGKASLIVSECKSRNPIEKKDVLNLTKIIDVFPKNRIDTYVLFSKLTKFSDEEVKICMTALDLYHKGVILLTDRELEGMHLYDEAKNEFQIDEHAVTWEHMAFNTEIIFVNKNKK